MEVSVRLRLHNFDLLPEELLLEILRRLPVKSLIRFRRVSRRWKDLITSPSFISMHLTATKNSPDCCNLYSCGGVVVGTTDWIRYIDEDAPPFPYDFLELNIGPSLPYKPPYGVGADGPVQDTPYSIVGYCDGIFCLSWNHLDRHSTYNGYNASGHTVIALCNPAIRELRILPLSITDSPPYKFRNRVDIGFGFDPQTNDYKVVKVVMLCNYDHSSRHAGSDCIEVYSMTSNSWRMVLTKGNNNYSATVQNVMACALHGGIYTSAGVLHWNMATVEYEVIASFHMDDDSFCATKFPSKYTSYQQVGGFWGRHQLSLLDDKAALICCYFIEVEFNRLEIFLLNNYDELDDDSSWSLATVLESFPLFSLPQGFWSKDLLLASHCQNKKPFLYDIVTRQCMDLHQLTRERGFFYRESLVSVKRGCGDCY